MDDFIFGTLATDELRLADVRRRRGGVTHRQRRIPLDPLPGETVQLELMVGPTACPTCDRAWVYWSVDGQDPQGAGGAAVQGHVTEMETVGAAWDTLLWGYARSFRAVLPPQPAGTVLRYRLSAGTPDGQEVPADGGAMYAIYIDDDPPPVWAREAVVYEIFVDRFNPGGGKPWFTPATPAGFYGGTLNGITEKLDYILELGANVLWLTPIFPSPSHHGYDATDLMEIEPRLGGKADLRRLLDEAHARGVRVLLDFVPNHWSSRHPTFQAALADPHSPYRQWYNFTDWPHAYETFFGVRDLPQVNLRYGPARQHMLDAAAYWLEFGVDGYRLDYAIGPTPDFWADFRRVTRRARPDCWTFGEVVEPSDSQLGFTGLLDGCLDFMLLEALRQTFAFGRWDARCFEGFLSRHEAFFPPGFSRPSFLDNHDMNRILWAMGGDQRRLRLAALCQFTLSGPPVIYYGTEVGLSQERDVRQNGFGLPEESRLPMLWGEAQDRELFRFYQGLARLRKQHPCLRDGLRRTVQVSPSTLAYTREAGGERLLVALNLSVEDQSVLVPGLWGKVEAETGGARLRPQGGGTQIDLAPLSGAVLREE